MLLEIYISLHNFRKHSPCLRALSARMQEHATPNRKQPQNAVVHCCRYGHSWELFSGCLWFIKHMERTQIKHSARLFSEIVHGTVCPWKTILGNRVLVLVWSVKPTLRFGGSFDLIDYWCGNMIMPKCFFFLRVQIAPFWLVFVLCISLYSRY